MAEILKGKPVTERLIEELRIRTDALKEAGIEPCLGIIRVGENPGDISYEKGALKKAEEAGIKVEKEVFDKDVSEEAVLDKIRELNGDDNIHGILIFRPLPNQIDDEKVKETLIPSKDMDGITEGALAGVFMNTDLGYPPCTAEAVIELLGFYGIDVKGKKAVIIGRSLVIGRPVAMMLMHKNATITICHTKTTKEDLVNICKNADIIVTCAGAAASLTKDMVGKDQIIIDVGINLDENGKLCGDVKFDEVEQAAAKITPVPGGIGGITSALLMKHVVIAAEKAKGK